MTTGSFIGDFWRDVSFVLKPGSKFFFVIRIGSARAARVREIEHDWKLPLRFRRGNLQVVGSAGRVRS